MEGVEVGREWHQAMPWLLVLMAADVGVVLVVTF